MTSPLVVIESPSIAIYPSSLPYQLFICNKKKEDLAGTGALNYIEWGESKGYNLGSTVSKRKLWYGLGVRKTVQTAMNYQVDSTARTFFASDGILFIDNFHEIHSTAASAVELCAAMNSSVSQLLVNTLGRGNFGGGLIKMQVYELANLSIANPGSLPKFGDHVFGTVNWDVLTPSSERHLIDDAVFEVLGLTQGERDAVYEGVTELVGNRRRRAQSV